MLPREIGYAIGVALERRRFKAARSLLDTAIADLASKQTLRDYSEPLSEICTDTRTVNLFEKAGAVTVEQFYRTSPRQFLLQADKTYSSKSQIAKQSEIIEAKYGRRLHGLLSYRATTHLLASDVLNVVDCCLCPSDRLARALSYDPALIREVALIQREYK